MTAGSAAEYARALCEQVRTLAITINGQALTLTISVGGASHKVNQEDWQTFLERADAALLGAKKNGRDQWLVAET